MNTEQDRLDFEAKHKVPKGLEWHEGSKRYVVMLGQSIYTESLRYNALWQGYQSAMVGRRGEAVALKAALLEVRRVLHAENDNEDGAIQDTIWRGPAETLFDYIDAALGDEDPNGELFTSPQPAQTSFQSRVSLWMQKCFGPTISADIVERSHRFLEEALELVQACGCTKSEAYQLVDYVFGRPVGEKRQEVGGVAVTLAALCEAQELDMHLDGEIELERINEPQLVEKIRAKQAAKPKHSPLPQAIEPAQPDQWNAAIEALKSILENDGGEGSKCFDAQKLHQARSAGFIALRKGA